ncbi:MAG: hypothetical protein ACW990_10610, partial [Promethearchaeota archaeon]
LSETEFRGETITEIAGIGSIIEEHIKIFVPILEDAWVGARKEIMRDIKSSISKEQEKPIAPPPRRREEPLKVAPAVEPTKPEEKTVELKAPSFLSSQFDNVLKIIDTKTGLEISTSLEGFQSEYVKKKGYNSVLKNIHTSCNDLKAKTELLSQPEKDELKMNMKLWRQQLDL